MTKVEKGTGCLTSILKDTIHSEHNSSEVQTSVRRDPP